MAPKEAAAEPEASGSTSVAVADGKSSPAPDTSKTKDAAAPSSSDVKGKRKRTAEDDEEDDDDDDDDDGAEPEWHKDGEKVEQPMQAQGDWQAVWSAEANAYYFWNQKSGETTWTNPLQPAEGKAETGPSTTAAKKGAERPADFGGIDPDLAFLDPSLAYGARQGITGAQQARFNSRTGRFEGADARTPGHVSDIERFKRQSAFFFDVNGWEKQTDAEQEKRRADIAAGKDPDADKHRAPTKAELARYKEKAKEKKKAKQAWLYD